MVSIAMKAGKENGEDRERSRRRKPKSVMTIIWRTWQHAGNGLCLLHSDGNLTFNNYIEIVVIILVKISTNHASGAYCLATTLIVINNLEEVTYSSGE